MLAEELALSLRSLTGAALDRVRSEAKLRPERWLSALWLAISASGDAAEAAAALVAQLGSTRDAGRLREAAKSNKQLRSHAVHATRRLAQSVLIDDLGSVTVHIGSERVRERLRRKVVGLLCYLASRPGMSATRDEVLEALWADLTPETAGNSLHQTIYYLRRVFEPDYREGLSAGYVGFDGEIVSLDRDLFDTSSNRCWDLLRRDRRPSTSGADALLRIYSARYALDFAYEEWAAPYRDTLHAAVLAYVEAALHAALSEGELEAAIRVARAALQRRSRRRRHRARPAARLQGSGRRAAARSSTRTTRRVREMTSGPSRHRSMRRIGIREHQQPQPTL